MNKLNYLLSFTAVLSMHIASAQLLKSDQSDREVVTLNESDTLELYSENFAGLQQLDSHVSQYKVFISGENHTYTESNARIWLKMIKYLHKQAGVRNVIFEYGYSYGWLVNEYLQTGDTVLFNSIKNFAYPEYSEAIKDLRAFNESLDSTERIYLCAIDIERGAYPVVKLLQYLLPSEYEAHDSIRVHLQSLQSLAAYNEAKLKEQEEEKYVTFSYKSSSTLRLIQENFLKFEAEYKAILGDGFDLFRSVLVDKLNERNLWYEYDRINAVQQYVYREDYMHHNFLEQSAAHPGAWFGQFGRCHTTKNTMNSNACEWYMFQSLANRIEHTKGDVFKDSIMTLGIVYKNDRNMGVKNDEFEALFDAYFKQIPGPAVHLLEVAKDSTLDSAYGHDFNFMLLNSITDRGEAYEDIYSYYDGMDDDIGVAAKFGISLVQREIGLESLNELFDVSGAEGSFNSPIYGMGVSLMVGSKDKGSVPFYSGTEIGGYLSDSVNIPSANINYQLKGFYYRSQSLYNLTSKLKFLDVLMGLELGFERLKLTAKQTTGNPNNILMGFVGDTRKSSLANPAFTLGGAFGIDINIKRLYFGMMGSYAFDVSNKKWLVDGNRVKDSPSTSFTGLSTVYRLGLFF